MFVYGNDWNPHTVFREMLAVTNHKLPDLFEGAGIDARPPSGHRFTTIRAVVSKFDCLAVFEEKNLLRNCAHVVRQSRMTEQLAILAVNGNEIARPHQV